MIEFFPPSLEHFGPLFVQIAQMGLILPRWGLILPRIPQYLFFTQQSHSPVGDMYEHKTPLSPPQNTAFPGLNLQVGKMNYHLGNLDPNGAKWLKSGQKNSSSGQKLFFIFIIIVLSIGDRLKPAVTQLAQANHTHISFIGFQ